MNVTRLDEAAPYSPPKHDGCFAMHLQHRSTGAAGATWLGCSYYMPGGAADWDASPLDKIYLVLDGELLVETDHDTTTLRKMDSVFLAGGENRKVSNQTNQVSTLLVVMPYPEGGDA